ncbi:MAG: hypothetical protein HY544_00380 [Candidatus Diapherotrites archaeon]|uniref:Uncharacterized protein n=1 Tax=Candidatus Iainarchaeum sp. TaxID=3101447 RepID=A0A8T3YLK5_9ARCH|nr:hypothetical protein [Candidatus Diapherotrites archaeon]
MRRNETRRNEIISTTDEEVKEEDIIGEEKFEISKDAFKFPVNCCSKKTILANKKLSINAIEFSYSVWQCSKCKKEYLDSEQAKRLEKFWMLEKVMENRSIRMERAMNFDGKTFFFRFPKEISKGWHKGDLVDINLINSENNMFFIEIKHQH